jgi:hypothetical protein
MDVLKLVASLPVNCAATLPSARTIWIAAWAGCTTVLPTPHTVLLVDVRFRTLTLTPEPEIVRLLVLLKGTTSAAAAPPAQKNRCRSAPARSAVNVIGTLTADPVVNSSPSPGVRVTIGGR